MLWDTAKKIQLPCPEPKRDDSEEAVENTLQRLGPPCLDSPEQSNLDSLDNTVPTINIPLIGTSFFYMDIELPSDCDVDKNVTKMIQAQHQ